MLKIVTTIIVVSKFLGMRSEERIYARTSARPDECPQHLLNPVPANKIEMDMDESLRKCGRCLVRIEVRDFAHEPPYRLVLLCCGFHIPIDAIKGDKGA